MRTAPPPTPLAFAGLTDGFRIGIEGLIGLVQAFSDLLRALLSAYIVAYAFIQ